MADLATRFASALIAPQDYIGSSRKTETAHEQAHEIIAAARDLIGQLASGPSPLAALMALHQASGDHVLFARIERASETIAFGPMCMTVDRAVRAAPRWAVVTLFGEPWYKAGLLALPSPFRALCASTQAAKMLTPHLARSIDKLQLGQHSTSRAPALVKLLASYGPPLSGQIEALLGAIRLGVRLMIASLSDLGILERTTHAGIHLYSADLTTRAAALSDTPMTSALFTAAFDGYNCSMADIEGLLARRGMNFHESDGEDKFLI